MTTTAPKRALLYVRLSKSDDSSTSIDRQKADLQALAKAENWQVVDTLEDDGISGRKRRANADRALAMLRDGSIDILAVWKFDRWSRMGLRAVADLLDALEESRVRGKYTRHFYALQDGLNTTQTTFPMIASILSEIARIEAENTSIRVKSSRAKAIDDGFFHGGTVPWGYRVADHPTMPDHKALVPDGAEQAVLLHIVDGVLRHDWSLTDAVRWLNRSPVIPPRRAPRWSPTAVQMILTGHALLGRVTKDGAPIYGDDGNPVAPWEPLVSLADWQALRARFSDVRTRSRATAQTTAPKRRDKRTGLLSGLVYCTCGAAMYRNNMTRKLADGTRVDGSVYVCSAAGQGKECKVNTRATASKLEDYITGQFLADYGRIPAVEVTETTVGTDPAQLAEVEAAIQATLDELRDPDADQLKVLDRLNVLHARSAELKSAPARVEYIRTPLGMSVAELWERQPDRRAWLLSGAVQGVTVLPGKRGRGFDTDRVQVDWTADHGDPYIPDYNDPTEYSSGPR
ncbi:hypothetical protein GCM10022288_26530 [Gryllotalpicola kribbensis]|uniref:Recombinase family protein n=1 Tax=Gryllotalpicola kribbensis TaxID=993084 RepID=A0ABP8AYF1_9MICO